MATRVIMPQLGESVVEGTVMKWLVQEGEQVSEMQSLLEVNTDKVDTEIPSPASGILLKVLVGENTTVKAGTVLAWIGQSGEAIEEEAEKTILIPAVKKPEEQLSPKISEKRETGFISPVVAKMASEYNVDLSQISGTGENGRITKQDLLRYIEGRKSASETPAWETPGEGDLFRPTEMLFSEVAPIEDTVQLPVSPSGDKLIPHSIMRKTIAQHMVLSKHTSPHVTTVMEADMQRVTAHRQAHKEAFERDGVHLTYTVYFIAGVINALKAYPMVNSSWSDDGVIVHSAINVSVAVSLGEDGLIVPVIKGADQLSLLGIARHLNELAERARARKLTPDEVKGGTFSITNHGTGGSLFATPVINQPQCAILGVGAVKKRPVVVSGDAIAVRPMVYLTLTFDHRILDGAIADHFLAKVVETLENWK